MRYNDVDAGIVTGPNNGTSICPIGADVGQFHGALLIKGEIRGNVVGPKATVSPSGTVVGDVMGEDVVIEGSFTGNIQAQSVSITSQAVVAGDVAYRTLSIEHGARFEGTARKLK